MGVTPIVILAAGRGVRMRSSLPKVLHEVAGKPMLDRVVATARGVLASEDGGRIVVVVGAGRERVIAHLARHAPDVVTVVQDPQLGTGDAVRKACAELADASSVIVLSGDVPLLTKETVQRLRDALSSGVGAIAAFVTAQLTDGLAYGRVIRDANGEVVRIVEAKDASPEERQVCEINGGVYAFDGAFLRQALPALDADNAAGEIYLTDVLGLGVRSGARVAGVKVGAAEEILGVNSRQDLALLEGLLRKRAVDAAMSAGATFLRPDTVTLDDSVVLSEDVVVEPFVTLAGNTRVGKGSRIGQGSVVSDSEIGESVILKPYCVLEGSRVGDGCIIGPFARLREGTELAEGVHVGNFVETKKARLAKGVKANHLSYLGDTTIGERTNVGAGVITCNYDGFTKSLTTIGADVFVGSDSQLVAPVTIADGAIVGAGTTVTQDVPADALVLARSPQKNLEGYARTFREKRRAQKTLKGG